MRLGKQAEAPRSPFRAFDAVTRHLMRSAGLRVVSLFWGLAEVHKILRGDGTSLQVLLFLVAITGDTVVQLIVASESAQRNMYIRYATLPCFPDGILSEAISIPPKRPILVIKSSYKHATGPYRTFSEIPPMGCGRASPVIG